jgi:hypothetical protein
MPHHRRKAFITIEHRQTTSQCIPVHSQEGPCPLAQDRGCHTNKLWSAHPRARNAHESKAIKEEENLSTSAAREPATPKATVAA